MLVAVKHSFGSHQHFKKIASMYTKVYVRQHKNLSKRQLAIRDAVSAAEKQNVKNHVPLLVWHDQTQEWKLNGSFPGISVTNSLHKIYPEDTSNSPYAGGIILFLHHDIGVGIGFTRQQVYT